MAEKITVTGFSDAAVRALAKAIASGMAAARAADPVPQPPADPASDMRFKPVAVGDQFLMIDGDDRVRFVPSEQAVDAPATWRQLYIVAP